jgi:hypothetical protein
MKLRNIFFVPAVLLLLLTCSLRVFADTRNIYIGDIVKLQISFPGNVKLSTEELNERFKAFEIVEFKDENGEYLISLRSFNVGRHVISLGDKEILINIQSVKEDIQRESIFEGDTGVAEPGIIFHWSVLFHIAAGIFILSGGYVLVKTLLKGVIKRPSPLQVFIRRSGSLSTLDDGYFVDLTFYFKEYLESLYRFRIIGKTSTEIVNELKGIDLLNIIIPEIQDWLTECDRLKFTGVKAGAETKQEHYTELLEIVKRIDARQNEVTK